MITSLSGINAEEIKINTKESTDNAEELDQFQNDTNAVPIFIGQSPLNSSLCIQMAQSFIPQKEVLTKIELYVCKNETSSQPLTVGLRDNLSGKNLVELNLPASYVPNLNGSNVNLNMSWVEFNVPDFVYDSGKAYYIVCYTENITDNWYLWGHNNDSGSYANGEAYISYDEGQSWINQSKPKIVAKPKSTPGVITALGDGNNQSDMCFKIYGINSTQLTITFPFYGEYLNTTIKNTGSFNATGVYFNITVKGGFFGYIDSQSEGPYLPPVSAGEEFNIYTDFFGIGWVDVNVTVSAANAKTVTKSARGFVVLNYIIIIPTITL